MTEPAMSAHPSSVRDAGSYGAAGPCGAGRPVFSDVRVLVACEYSGAVREAFRRRGFDAWSCDLYEPAEDGSAWHIVGDAAEVAYQGAWDLMIAHPPCTHLSVSGARHFEAKRADGRQGAAIDFFLRLARAPIDFIAIENPVCIMSSVWRKPDQTIQPWQFGHGETKATCLWLKGLPPLVPTHKTGGDLFTPEAPTERVPRIHLMPPSPTRWKERSRTYAGIADAMAQQWGDFILSTRDTAGIAAGGVSMVKPQPRVRAVAR